MFFTYLGRVVAYVVFGLASLRIAFALLIAGGYLGPYDEAKKYLSATKETGQVIDQAVYVCFLMIALGVLCEISIVIKARSKSQAT